MDVRPRPDARDDAELVRAATAGDRGAFAAIYDRYADRLHDFCWGLLRDRDEAADATQDAFVVAAERLGQLRDPERLRPWLYAVARSQALRRVRARSRVAPEEEMTQLHDPAGGPEQSDLRELVWNAAAGLSERDRALLDLHLRHGLEGAELGEAMGVEPGHAYVLLSRLPDQVERSLGAFLVARLGRQDCPDLSQILTGWDGRFSPLVRKRVARHVDACEVCGTARRRLASPLALLAAVPPLPAPASLRDQVLSRVQLPSPAGPGAAGPPDAGPPDAGPPGTRQPDPPLPGPPEGERSRTKDSGRPAIHSPPRGGPARSGGRRRGAVLALVAALLVAVGVGVGLGWERSPAVSSPTGGQGGPVVAGAATSVAPTPPPTSGPPATTGSSTTATSGATSTTVPVAPPVLAVTPARVDLGAAAAGATLTIRNGGGEPLSWTAAPSATWLRVSPASGDLDGGQQARLSLAATRDGLPEGTAGARVRLTWGGGPARSVVVALRVEHAPAVTDLAASPPEIFAGPCTPTTTLVEATVTDESPLSSVTLHWGRQQVPMTQRNGRWFARLGPVTAPGVVPWQVVASDDRGNTASAPGPAVRVLACP